MASEPAASSTVTSSEASSWVTLKSRIKQHYDLCSSYYYELWGEHIHHGYFVPADLPKEQAQVELIKLLVKRAGGLDRADIRVLDVGCGIGGTSRYLAREYGCQVTGVTISGEQVRMARKISGSDEQGDGQGFISIDRSPSTTGEAAKAGQVRFVELDAEKMGDFFDGESFDIVWISEALSHFPSKPTFFQNAAKLLRGGRERRLVLADWFKAEHLSPEQHTSDIAPIESGMLLPPLQTKNDYVTLAKSAGLEVLAEPMDISNDVAKTWDLSIGLVADPKLWALAFTQGRDFIAFLRAFSAMRSGYRNGTFRYAVMVFKLAQ